MDERLRWCSTLLVPPARLWALLVLLSLLPGCATFDPPDRPYLLPDERAELVRRIGYTLEKYAYAPGVDFGSWPQMAKAHQEELESTSAHADLEWRLNEILSEFGVSHLSLEAPEGSLPMSWPVHARLTPEGLEIAHLDPRSSWAKAGLLVGDVVTHTAGLAVAQGSAEPRPVSVGEYVVEVRPEFVRLEDGAEYGVASDLGEVAVRLIRDGEVIELLIGGKRGGSAPRKPIPWDSKFARVRSLPDGLVLLRLPRFDFPELSISDDSQERDRTEFSTYDYLKPAVGAQGIILDFRQNLGGGLGFCLDFVTFFTAKDTVLGYIEGRNVYWARPRGAVRTRNLGARDGVGRSRLISAREPIISSGTPVVILINEHTASAAELAAVMLRDTRGAVMVGQFSAGMVLGSGRARIGWGYSLQFPMTHFVTPSNETLEGNPIQPDVLLDPPPPGPREDGDPWVKEAVRILHEMIAESECSSGPPERE
jgi:carboxyl-terminal processing protease